MINSGESLILNFEKQFIGLNALSVAGTIYAGCLKRTDCEIPYKLTDSKRLQIDQQDRSFSTAISDAIYPACSKMGVREDKLLFGLRCGPDTLYWYYTAEPPHIIRKSMSGRKKYIRLTSIR